MVESFVHLAAPASASAGERDS
ncbi:hypothetical protein MPC1_15400002 [Methylocella tundrae]|nr:hypothetical protein MPC1_15400002 [Methylocella tundrae]